MHASLGCALVACADGSGGGSPSPGGTSGLAETTAESPTSGAPAGDATTGWSGESTATASTAATTGEDASTGGEPVKSCVEHRDVNACEFDPRCRWAGVFQFFHGGQGCQGDVIEFCVSTAEDVPSSWYRGEGGEYQVLQFDYTPDDLSPEWRPCDCDGPLACLCGAGAPDCPDRVGEFCAANFGELSCASAAIDGELRCGWFRVSPEGPRDDKCSQQAARWVCLAATEPGADACVKFPPPYPQCGVANDPVYWREVDGLIEVTSSCGPVPAGSAWTACAATDTPEQPDECGCLCL